MLMQKEKPQKFRIKEVTDHHYTVEREVGTKYESEINPTTGTADFAAPSVDRYIRNAPTFSEFELLVRHFERDFKRAIEEVRTQERNVNAYPTTA